MDERNYEAEEIDNRDHWKYPAAKETINTSEPKFRGRHDRPRASSRARDAAIVQGEGVGPRFVAGRALNLSAGG
jgi:hypothetical protein